MSTILKPMENNTYEDAHKVQVILEQKDVWTIYSGILFLVEGQEDFSDVLIFLNLFWWGARRNLISLIISNLCLVILT